MPEALAALPSAHVRRVTLNLIRGAACCPPELREVIDHLAGECEWSIDRLSSGQLEIVYGYVDADLAERAKAEYSADIESIVDHRSSDAMCLLCGHKHIRWEFTLRNGHGGRNHKTGSTCIEEYGLNVDGAATAEDALALLRGAIAAGKRRASRDAWQEEYPDHADRMAALTEAFRVIRSNQYPPWRIRHYLPCGVDHFYRTAKKWLSASRSVLAYYNKNEFLTDKKTAQAFGAGGLIAKSTELMGWLKSAEAAAVAAAAPGTAVALTPPSAAPVTTKKWTREAVVAWWSDLVTAHPFELMTDHQARRVRYWQRINLNPDRLNADEQALIAEVKAGTSANKTAEPTGPVDNSDLPF
jgi:hypothetical protein